MNIEHRTSCPPHELIRASAGTGKTYQLTTRYLWLLAAGASPGGILATTFTRKAAGEILGRVLHRVAQAAAESEQRDLLARDLGRTLNEADCRVMLRSLVDELHRLAICTIDSFFNRIATAFRLELDMPLDPQLVDASHPQARQLRLEAIEAMLADHHVATLHTLLRQVHHDSVARSVTDAIDGIVTDLYDLYREAPDRACWTRLSIPPGRLDEAELAAALEAIDQLEPELPLTGKGQPNKRFIQGWEASRNAARAGDWEAFLKCKLVERIDAGEADYVQAEISPAWTAAYQPVIAHARAELVAALVNQSQATFELLQRFDAHDMRLRRQQGLVLFADLTHKLARELPAMDDELLLDIYFRLDGRVQHMLLDEFQDTSIEQWRVLQPLADEILSQHGERSFFCVGDVKQAIYGWRGGCVELFDQLEAGPVTVRSLNESRRTAPPVLDAVNMTFSSLSTCPALAEDSEAAARWEADFEPHEAFQRDMPGHVQLSTSVSDDEPDAGNDDDADAEVDAEVGADEGATAEASSHERWVAKQVRALHDNAPSGRIGVLVSTRKAVNRLLFELRRQGLRVSGEAGSPVADTPAVAAVLAALTMADHPDHKAAAAFHVANSPVGEMLEMTDTGPLNVQRMALAIRQRLAGEGYPAVLADWARQLTPACDARSLGRLMQLVELAEAFGPMQTLRPGQFVEYVQATPMEDPHPAPIRVMTIHASKGLEFDAVVLAELDRRLNNTFTSLVERDEAAGPITGVYHGANATVRRQVAHLEHVHAEQRARQRREDLCNLYVAMTRAKHGLYMFTRPLQQAKSGKAKSIGLCFAAILRHALARDDEGFEGGELVYETGSAAWMEAFAAARGEAGDRPDAQRPVASDLAQGLKRRDGGASPRRGWVSVTPSGLARGGKVRAGELLRMEGGEARQRGTLIHHWMQQVGFIDEPDAIPPDEVLLEQASEVVPDASRPWIAAQLADFHAIAAQPTVRASLARDGAAELWREHAFMVRRPDGTLLRGQFDRVAVHRGRAGAATHATLIDFKTDRVADERALTELTHHYREQVQAYREALGRLLRLEPARVRAVLLFLACDRAVTIDPPGR